MRHKERYNSAKSHGSINLPWVADHITVFNPSPNMVLVRTTGNDEPNTPQSGDVVLLPFAARTYPVQSAQFGVKVTGFGVPLPSFSEAFPQDVELFFTAGEMPPVIADISLSTSNSGVVLDTATGDSLIINHLDIPVPPSIHRLSVVPYVFSVADVSLDISGHQTGQLYYRSSGLSYSNRRPYVQISALDTSLDFIYTPLGAGAFTLTVLGFAEYGPTGLFGMDGRELVNPLAPGATTVPITVSPNPLPVQPWPALPVAEKDVFGAVNNPGLGTIICTTGALVGGTYCLEAEIYSNDAAANGHHAIFGIGGVNRTFITYPCCAPSIVMGRVTIAAAAAVAIQNNIAVAGAQVSAAIRAYKLS